MRVLIFSLLFYFLIPDQAKASWFIECFTRIDHSKKSGLLYEGKPVNDLAQAWFKEHSEQVWCSEEMKWREKLNNGAKTLDLGDYQIPEKDFRELIQILWRNMNFRKLRLRMDHLDSLNSLGPLFLLRAHDILIVDIICYNKLTNPNIINNITRLLEPRAQWQILRLLIGQKCFGEKNNHFNSLLPIELVLKLCAALFNCSPALPKSQL